MKVVVDRWEDDQPIYNARFLAFATHYDFAPWACKKRRSKTKGKVERPFQYVEGNLLNGRTFRSLDHLNEVRAWWLANRADTHPHRETKARPIDRFAEEVPHLLPLPANPYDTAEVAYRVVSNEGHIAYRQNLYSVPWQTIGKTLPVRITEDEVIVYGPDIREIARHPLFPRSASGQRSTEKRHRIVEDVARKEELLRQRFEELGEIAVGFFEDLVRHHRYGKEQARKVLELLTLYRPKDLLAALDRARRFRALSYAAVERILAAQAQPRPPMESMQCEARQHLREDLRDEPVRPREGSEYQKLLFEPGTEGSDVEAT
jgi:hypothetical protein